MPGRLRALRFPRPKRAPVRVEHQRHVLGLVGEGDQMEWIVAPAPALRGVPNIAADLEFPMYVDVLPDATIVVEALAASPSRKSPDGRSVAAPMTQIRPGEIIRPGSKRKEFPMVHAPAEPYPALDHLRVVDAMHPGLITCSLDVPLRTVARMMATYRVHAILVTAHGEEELAGGGLWGVISDTDLLRAAEAGDLDERPARTIAATPVLMVDAGDDLAHAARLMVEHEVSHLLVVEPQSTRPIGVLSTLDIARALAGFPEHHPVSP